MDVKNSLVITLLLLSFQLLFGMEEGKDEAGKFKYSKISFQEKRNTTYKLLCCENRCGKIITAPLKYRMLPRLWNHLLSEHWDHDNYLKRKSCFFCQKNFKNIRSNHKFLKTMHFMKKHNEKITQWNNTKLQEYIEQEICEPQAILTFYAQCPYTPCKKKFESRIKDSVIRSLEYHADKHALIYERKDLLLMIEERITQNNFNENSDS